MPPVMRRTVLLRALKEQWLSYKDKAASYEARATEALGNHRELARIRRILTHASETAADDGARATVQAS